MPQGKQGGPDRASGGKDKVMVYVPPEVHRAVRQVALDDGRSASDVYVEAARAYLAARGMAAEAEPPEVAQPAPLRPDLSDLASGLDRLVARVDELIERKPYPLSDGNPGARPATGTAAADAMAALLGVLGKAGEVGMASSDLTEAMIGAGVRSGTAEVARAALSRAGLIHRDGKRWFVVRS